MRKYIYIAITLFISLAASAQTLYTTKQDSVPATGDSITLQTKSYRGLLQWQCSTDGQLWTDLTGKTNPQVKIPATTEAFYRAKLTEGNCFATYTDSAVVLLQKEQNTTVDPKAVAGTILLKSDGSTFTYKNIGNIQLPQGTLLVATDSASNIRIVTAITQKGDTLIVQTTQGSMADIFINKSFNLTTAASSNAQNVKGLSQVQQSRALTDAKGFIHPVSVVSNASTLQKVKSNDITGSVPMVNFGSNFSGDTIYYDNGLLLKFTDGYYNFDSELKCEFQFQQPHFDLAHLKFNAGKLKRFSFYTDPDVTGIDAKLVLLAKAEGEKTFENEIVLVKNVFNKSFKFLVGEVPVWMDVTMDLMAKASGSISSELSVSGGASASAHSSLGATYENGTWKLINTLTKTLTLQGPDITGIANEQMRIEVYPHINVKFYKLIGPWLDIAPYVSQEMNVSISGNSDFEIYGGTDASLGIDVTAFDKEVASFSHEFSLKKDTLYQTPYKLKLLSGDKQTGKADSVLTNPIVLQALDNKDIPVVNAQVFLQSISDNSIDTTLNTDNNGKLFYKWTLGNVEGDQKLEAFLKNGKDEEITTADTIVKATCKSKMPTIITASVSNIDETTATCGGNVTKNGGAAVTARGVCWNTTGTPTITDNKTTDVTGDSTFITNLTGLTTATTYYICAYATNKNGTAYGDIKTFTTKCECDKHYGTFTDSRDGHVYKTITIGTQTWMAENLAYLPVTASDPTVGSEDEANSTTPYYYVYDKVKYGVLYNWYAALTSAPPGWHLPTDAEWTTLIDYLGGTSVAGGKMKSTTGWDSPRASGTNSSCFSALPGGTRSSSMGGAFYDVGSTGYWWSSTGYDTGFAWVGGTTYVDSGNVDMNGYYKEYGFSVRCVRD